jgi:hypothetical protein
MKNGLIILILGIKRLNNTVALLARIKLYGGFNMKIWKQFTFFGILALIVLSMVLIACSEEEHKHNWGNWVETTPTTVEEFGEETRECSTCGEKEKRPIAKLIGCNCPKGTTHEPDEKCCEWVNCECGIIHHFAISDVFFVFENRNNDITSWEKMSLVVQAYVDQVTRNPQGSHAAAITNLLYERNVSEYKIIVDYSDEGKEIGFTAIDGKTLTVGDFYLANSSVWVNDTGGYIGGLYIDGVLQGDQINPNRLRSAFQAMLALPLEDE